jgi:hypothetical protein
MVVLVADTTSSMTDFWKAIEPWQFNIAPTLLAMSNFLVEINQNGRLSSYRGWAARP